MKSFDFSPLLIGGYKKFVVGPALWSVPILALVYFLGYKAFAISFFYGIIIGLLDNVIMITGMRKALPYDKDPQRGLAIMKRYRVYRIISASTLVVLLLKQGHNVVGTCIGLLLTHIFLIINLTIIAYRLNKVGDAKKGE